jgi:hypothetical protein
VANAPTVTWPQVHAWRLRRQLLDPLGTATAAEVVRRLCGVQAQVAASAEHAIAVRQAEPQPGEVTRALADRELVKTWAMRGTLHLLPPEVAGAYLALLGAARTWERASWQRSFGVTVADMAALMQAVDDALTGRVLTRDELVAEVVERTGNPGLEEQLRSGWGAVLKPLAWQGYLCHGPSQGNRVSFARPADWLPTWGGVPEPGKAAQVAIPSFLRAYGPATAAGFDAWLARGASRKAALRGWFASLEDQLVTVYVEGGVGADADGELAYLLAEDLDELSATPPTTTVRLLPGFDQYVLGPGTGEPQLVAPHRRAEVSKTAGWISPVVVAGGRVAGVWEAAGAALQVTLFKEEAEQVPVPALEAEAARVAGFLGRDLTLSVRRS